MSHTGTIHIMLLEMLMVPQVLILPCFWILIELCLLSGSGTDTMLWRATLRCQAGKWNSFLMRCVSETSSLMSLSSLIKQNEIAFSSFPVFYKISLNWSLYLEVVENYWKCSVFEMRRGQTSWLRDSTLLFWWKVILSTLQIILRAHWIWCSVTSCDLGAGAKEAGTMSLICMYDWQSRSNFSL